MSTPIVPAPAFAKAITYNRETRDFDLLLDGQFVGTARSFYEGEEKLDALVYDQLQALRIDLADEAAAANANLDALEQSENEHADTLGAPEPDEPTPPDDDDLAAEGLRIASPDEAGWTWRNLWVTDASDEDEQAATDEAEMEGMAYHAQRNAEDAAADEAAEQAADEAAAQAMDASMDMTCACQLCGGVMPDEAALVGEQMACGWCAGKAQGIARFIAGENPYFTACRRELAREPELDEFVTWMARQYAAYGARPVGVAQANAFSIWLFARAGLADPPTLVEARPGSVRLLWSWAGNATALGAVVSERRAAWLARQERMRVTAGKLGLLSREAK